MKARITARRANTTNNIILRDNTIIVDSRKNTLGNHCKNLTEEQYNAMMQILAETDNNCFTVAEQYPNGRIHCKQYGEVASAITEAYKVHANVRDTHYAWACGVAEDNKAVIYYEV